MLGFAYPTPNLILLNALKIRETQNLGTDAIYRVSTSSKSLRKIQNLRSIDTQPTITRISLIPEICN
jgi:hypothetical protein